MGREIRRVPKGWKHPNKDSTQYPYKPGVLQPMHDEAFVDVARKWLNDTIAWDNGTHRDLVDDPARKEKYPFFWQWDGACPDPAYYRPKWTDEERACFQLYETTTEGTPMSPVFDTAEKMVRWLVKDGGYDGPHSEESARAFVKAGSVASFEIRGGKMLLGIDASEP